MKNPDVLRGKVGKNYPQGKEICESDSQQLYGKKENVSALTLIMYQFLSATILSMPLSD